MKTYLPKIDEIERKWYVVDAADQVLGRMAVRIADVLRGKNKPIFTRHIDCGDYVVVINAAKVVLSGNKESQKIYQDYSGYMGGQSEHTAAEIRERHPERLVKSAVRGMMPGGRLGRSMLDKLRVYPGPEHPHAGQKAEPLAL